MSNHTQPESTEAGKFLDRLEELVLILVDERFSSAADLWKIELDLLKVQREIQAAITTVIATAKRERHANSATNENLSDLRWARQQARRFGDALAWFYLDQDRKVIYPLARNDKVSPECGTDGERATLAASQQLAADGFGFPLLHDITDCLRIGDVTFIRSDGVQTVELKTQVKNRVVNDDGSWKATYKISLITASPLPDSFDPPSTVDDSGTDEMPGYFTNPPPRVVRQIKRMGEARAHQDAEANKIGEHDGNSFITARSESSAPSNHDALAAIIENAYRYGYASQDVEDTFIYVAFYDPNGIDLETVKDERLSQHLLNSSTLRSKSGRDSLLIRTVPAAERRSAELYLPYFLLPLPSKAIIDMLRGRLLILVLANGGRLIDALEAKGFTIEDASSTRKGFDLIVSFDLEDGEVPEKPISGHIKDLHLHVEEMLHEFRSVEYLSDAVTGMRGAMKLLMPEMRRRQTSRSNDASAKPALGSQA
ncbi:hypothetical protein [Jidongwangia harbinensis]|uniref:hypothetical protein n=1 Tax=Jidongwangia harbinensis TaxID=2878561 RepID=UPI001CD966FE|nr:hypothetical protein [Jidongwangia harbinensis]MCA2216906.1 hypothetical protein [Jidongwangia harbinensis]